MATVQPTLLGLIPDAPAAVKKAARAKRRPKPVVAATAPVEYTTGVDDQGRTVWTLRFPAPDKILSANGRTYWRTVRENAKTWREAVFVHARAAKLPTGLRLIQVDIELRFPTNGRRDNANYYTAMKPCVDALGPERVQVVKRGPRAGTTVIEVGYGLIQDDTQEFLVGPFVRIGPKVADSKRSPFGEVVVTITDLSEVAA